MDDNHKQNLSIFFLFNFAITKIRVAILFAEDGTRMCGIYFQLSPNISDGVKITLCTPAFGNI